MRPIEADIATIRSSTASPAMALLWRRSTRSLRLSIVDPRIDEGVQHVDDEVDGDEGRRDDERRAADRDGVGLEDRGDDVCAESRPVEDGLGQHRAAEKV